MGDVIITEQATVGRYRFKQHLVDSNTLKKIIAGPDILSRRVDQKRPVTL